MTIIPGVWYDISEVPTPTNGEEYLLTDGKTRWFSCLNFDMKEIEEWIEELTGDPYVKKATHWMQPGYPECRKEEK